MALIGRFHDHRGGTPALFTEEGSAAFHDVDVVALSPPARVGAGTATVPHRE